MTKAQQTVEAYKKTVDLLRSSSTFLVTSHTDPDGDAVGCMLSISSVLKRLGKRCNVICEDAVPPSYTFLEGADEVITAPDDPRAAPCDVAVVVDAAGLERVGWAGGLAARCKTVVNIDHHRSNVFFGGINVVEAEAGACGEIIYRVIRDLGAKLERPEAEALYVAILSDTGCFRFPSTTAETLRIAAHLMELGVKPYQVATRVYWEKSLASLKILGDALSSIEVTHDGKVATMDVTQAMYLRSGATSADTEGFANYPRSVDGVAIGVLIRETESGRYRVSLRAAEGYDVDKVARVFGGGGHATAAGFRIEGDLEGIKAKIRDQIGSYLNDGDGAPGATGPGG
jgi:phosphoesterase RecJ-like protein